MIDQDTIKIENFKGLFANYDTETIPPDHFKDVLNFLYLPAGPFQTRDGLNSILDVAAGARIVRVKRYQIPGADDRLIILDTNGNLYDSATVPTPILTNISMTDFAMVSLYGRAYISPNDGEMGLADTPVYVYDPSVSAVARPAAGDPPNGFTLTVAVQAPTAANLSIVNNHSPVDGAMTLTAGPPYVFAATPNSIRFQLTKGTSTITAMTWTVIGLDAGGVAQTKVYTNKVASLGPLIYDTPDIWSSITSITQSATVGAPGTGLLKVITTGQPPGKIEAGYHIIAVAYETDSGFITPPGPLSGTDINYSVKLVTIAKKALKITNIPVLADLPSGVTKIHILSSKAIVKAKYTGNPNDYELFFVPDTSGGIIDAGTTSTVINFFDADLVDSADFLKDNFAEIPAGVAMLATSKGRLVITGCNKNSIVGDLTDSQDKKFKDANDTVIWASVGGEPESVSKTDGFVIIKPGGSGVKNVAEYRDLIYVLKSAGTFTTQDNNDLPSTWTVATIDDATGTECHGISVPLGSDGATEDAFIVASKTGCEVFTGIYADRSLSWKIKEVWDSINPDTFNQTEVALDPTNKFIIILCRISTDKGTGPDTILFADYNEGLDWQNVKWSIWKSFGGTIDLSTVLTQQTTSGVRFVFGSRDSEYIYSWVFNSGDRIDTNGDATTSNIEQYFELYKGADSDSGGVTQFTGYRIRIDGEATVDSTIYGPGAVESSALNNYTITTTSVNNILARSNFNADIASVKVTLTEIPPVIAPPTAAIPPHALITRIWLYLNEAWTERIG